MKCSPILISVKARTYVVFTMALLFLTVSGVSKANAKEAKDMFAVCAACHTVGNGKLIGPDLKGINERRDEAWLIEFIQNSQKVIQSGDEIAVALFEEYNKIPMPPNDFSGEEVKSLLKYIDFLGEEKLASADAEADHGVADSHAEEIHALDSAHSEKDNSRNFLALVLIAVAVIVLVILDILFVKIIKYRALHILVLLGAMTLIGGIAVIEAQGLGRQQFYSPDQPIAFSHKVHAGQNEIDCRYCHTSVEKSRHAGIPSVQLCMNCHTVVKEGATTGKGEIAKIYDAFNQGKAIEWIKVHNVPDHVYFNHSQHVKIGKLDCKECHGDVENMDRITQVETLGMGWCIECHRETEVQFTDNDFYKNYTELHEELNAGKRSKVTVSDVGGNDCQKCHY
jgi:cytochrome c551/c552